MYRSLLATALLSLFIVLLGVLTPAGSQERARGEKPVELDTEYVPPPGKTIDHHASGFAKIHTAHRKGHAVFRAD